MSINADDTRDHLISAALLSAATEHARIGLSFAQVMSDLGGCALDAAARAHVAALDADADA